ncbi:hypothetical protein F4802DRAFT_327140 [Xylaria palmicola]|nr:hypothetical protein F4802DRAFT_327140 [Xylaria palmicola]
MSSRGGSIRYLYKHTPTPSDTSSASYDHGAIEFLLSYREREKRGEYDELMRLTREKCERILDDMFIKGVVQGRTKKADSLATTLRDLKNEARTTASDDPNETPNFKDWVLRGESIWEHPDMGDLVGIRIGLYFPDDVLRVVQRIEEEFDRKWLFGTVMGGRQPIQSRNVDIQSHANGPWHSLGPGGTAEHWEHYGYKSWQVVVEWPSPLEGIELPRVEIQVGTVVMQAWAEVQHNIIYKRSPFVLATPTMRRMIDGINGLAITTEIMLKQLERDLEAARREADEQSFQSGAELLDWFELTYLGKMEGRDRQNWRKAQREGVRVEVAAQGLVVVARGEDPVAHAVPQGVQAADRVDEAGAGRDAARRVPRPRHQRLSLDAAGQAG